MKVMWPRRQILVVNVLKLSRRNRMENMILLSRYKYGIIWEYMGLYGI